MLVILYLNIQYIGKDNGHTCLSKSNCRSKHCHHFKCVAKKPTKDGKCSRNNHEECVENQYCSKSKGDKCMDRKCSGFCGKGLNLSFRIS